MRPMLTLGCVAMLAGTAGAVAPGGSARRHAYFGETHVHTAYSLDAYIGGTRQTPDMVYRFAKGEAFEIGGTKRRFARPLEFIVVTDHAEYLGAMYSTMVDGAPGHDPPTSKRCAIWRPWKTSSGGFSNSS